MKWARSDDERHGRIGPGCVCSPNSHHFLNDMSRSLLPTKCARRPSKAGIGAKYLNPGGACKYSHTCTLLPFTGGDEQQRTEPRLKSITVTFSFIPGLSVLIFCCKRYGISCQNSSLLSDRLCSRKNFRPRELVTVVRRLFGSSE